MITYQDLITARLTYEPHSGFVTRHANYIAGENERILFGKQCVVKGYAISKGRVAWMLYYQCDLKQWEKIKFKNRNPYDTRIENLYIADLRSVRAVGSVHMRDSLGDQGANESRRQHCAARDLAGSNAEYIAQQLTLPGNIFSRPFAIPDEIMLQILISQSYGLCDAETITFALENDRWTLRFLSDESAIRFRFTDNDHIEIADVFRQLKPASKQYNADNRPPPDILSGFDTIKRNDQA